VSDIVEGSAAYLASPPQRNTDALTADSFLDIVVDDLEDQFEDEIVKPYEAMLRSHSPSPTESPTTPSPTDSPIFEEFEHIGCYADTDARALPFGPRSKIAVVECLADCDSLAECHGDCDSDSDCIGNLLCYHRSEFEDPLPVGCRWDLHLETSDYCYDPMKTEGINGWVPETCQIACIGYQYFAVQFGGECFCGKSFADATQYGSSSGCANGLGGSMANDLYENLMFMNLKSGGSSAAKHITSVTDETANMGDVARDTVVVVKVPQFGFEVFVFAMVAISAVLCVGLWCTRKKTVYTKVSYASEADTEENAAINDEQL